MVFGMKTIGLLGGMSWESTHYYALILVNKRLGGFTFSKNNSEIEQKQANGDWKAAAKISNAAQHLRS